MPISLGGILRVTVFLIAHSINVFYSQDYEFAAGKSEYEDVLQCNNEPSSRTPRGHQFPAAFMILASGLDKVGSITSNFLVVVRPTFILVADFHTGFNSLNF